MGPLALVVYIQIIYLLPEKWVPLGSGLCLGLPLAGPPNHGIVSKGDTTFLSNNDSMIVNIQTLKVRSSYGYSYHVIHSGDIRENILL